MYLVKVAGAKVGELSEKIKAALQVHETARVAARVRRQSHKPAAAATSRFVVIQPAADIQTGDMQP